MDLGLDGKQVLITGGSKGIGLALAHAFAAEGANIVVVARDQTVLESAAGEVARRHNARATAHACDLSEHFSADVCTKPSPTSTSSSITPVPFPAAVSPTSAWNLAGGLGAQGTRLYPPLPTLRCQHEGAQVRHHHQHHRYGWSRRAARLHLRRGGNGGLIAFTNALGAETPSYNVRVFGINPAATMTNRIVQLSRRRAKTRFGDESRWQEALGADKLPFGRIKTAEEVAALATMLAAPQVHYLSGTVIDMDGGGQWRAQ